FNPSDLGNILTYQIEDGNTLIQDQNSDFAIKIVGEFELAYDDFIF
ncbi:MAG: hypothetical protein JRJ44_02430, partial [Deltaproteobacteria bacterium]|nr:hypothetical protein [Deltaproteobacteria bacterium]